MRSLWLAVAATALVLYGCSGVQVHQDYDPSTDFQTMQAYRWETERQEKTGNLRIDNPLRDARIREALERLLQAKGVVKANDGDTAFLVRYQYSLHRRIESDGAGGGIGFGIGSYGRHGGIAFGTGSRVNEYEEGSLTVDFVDSTSQALLWRGTGIHRFREYDNPAKARRDIDTLVEKILAQFPPINR